MDYSQCTCVCMLIGLISLSVLMCAKADNTGDISSSMPYNSSQEETTETNTVTHVTAQPNTGVITNTTYAPDSGIVTLADVEQLLREDNETLTFLSGFTNTFQRDTVKEQLLFCPYTDLCGFSFNLTLPIGYIKGCRGCKCNYPDCMRLWTCCPDIIPDTFYEAWFSDDSKADADNTSISTTRCTLLHSTFRPKVSHLQGSSLLHAVCPSDVDEEVARHCSAMYTLDTVDSIDEILPVTDLTSTTTYRNKHCASCHGILEDRLQAWFPKLSCEETMQFDFQNLEADILEHVFEHRTCDIAYENDFGAPLTFCRTSLNTCNVTGLWVHYDQDIERRCHLYFSIVTYNYNTKFQNIFCLLCNGLLSEHELAYKTKPCLDIKICSRSWDDAYPFSGLLKLGQSSAETRASKQCANDEFYDTFRKRCTKLHCAQLHRMNGGRCQGYFTKFDEATYSLRVRLQLLEALGLRTMYWGTPVILNWFKGDPFRKNMTDPRRIIYPCSVELMYTLDAKFDSIDNVDLWTTNVSHIDIRLHLKVVNDHDPYELTKQMVEFDSDNSRVVSLYMVPGVKANLVLQVKDAVHGFDAMTYASKVADNVRNISDGIYTGFAWPDENDNILVPYMEPFTADKCDKTGETIPVDAIAIKDCMMVRVSIDILPWQAFDDGIFISKCDCFVYFKDFFYENRTSVWVCLDVYKQVLASIPDMDTQRTNIEEVILSIVLVPLSLLSLLITLVTFYALPSLLTLPGKNIVALSACLFVGQTLYLVSSFAGINKGTILCKVVGVCLHYFWLMVLFWMHVCTYHMFYVLSSTRVNVENQTRFIVYTIYAVIMSSVFVGATIIASMLKSNGLDIGYGSTVCNVSSDSMLSYTFVVPGCLVVASNIIMFVIVVVRLKRTPTIEKNVQNERNYLVIFTKLSTLTGMSWVFGFLYAWTGYEVFSFMFIIFNAAMGVFICASFVINRRILNLYKLRLQKANLSTVTFRLTNGTNTNSGN